LKLAYWSKLIG